MQLSPDKSDFSAGLALYGLAIVGLMIWYFFSRSIDPIAITVLMTLLMIILVLLAVPVRLLLGHSIWCSFKGGVMVGVAILGELLGGISPLNFINF